MFILIVVLVVVGVVANLISAILLLISAFQESVWVGLGLLFVPCLLGVFGGQAGEILGVLLSLGLVIYLATEHKLARIGIALWAAGFLVTATAGGLAFFQGIPLDFDRNEHGQGVLERNFAAEDSSLGELLREEGQSAKPEQPAVAPSRLRGKTTQEVTAILGSPNGSGKMGKKILWFYKQQTITFEGGVVVDIEDLTK